VTTRRLLPSERVSLQEALEILERHPAHPQTPALHDPIYLLLTDFDLAHTEELERALRTCGEHPATPELRRLLGAPPETPEIGISEVLARHGGDRDADPVEETRRRLERAEAIEATLRERMTRLEAQVSVLDRTANRMGAVGAFLLVFAILGWLAALGVWEIDWMDPPHPDDDRAEEREREARDEPRR